MLKKETELKALLTKQEYQELTRLMTTSTSKTTEQMNYYFDTPNEALRGKNITCRIRQKENQLIGTQKTHFYKTNEVYSIEETFSVPEFTTQFYIEGEKVELKGQLFTKRTKIPWENIGHFALDQNLYLGFVDYELEFEYLPQFEAEAIQIFASVLGLLGRSSPKFISISKSERFFQRLKSVPNTKKL